MLQQKFSVLFFLINFIINLKICKMKNLENYGVVSLDTKEMMEIDGGEINWTIVLTTVGTILLIVLMLL